MANPKLGIEKDAKFVKPAELENEINSADIIISDTDPAPGAEGDDQGVGAADDYKSAGGDSIGPESRPLPDENKKTKKDTSTRSPAKKEDDSKPIGAPVEQPKKKGGFLKRLFSGKESK